MNLHTLKPAKGATKAGKRIGRGQGSGKGGTSARGHKGAKSRSGWSKKRNFEGGQMPLQMRLPKRGFNSRNRVAYVAINLSNLSEIAAKYDLDNITLEALREKRIVRKTDRVKILANGELTKGISVEAHACSENAKNAVEAKGGAITLV